MSDWVTLTTDQFAAMEREIEEKDAEIERLRAKLTECDGKLGKRPCQTGRCMEFVRMRDAAQTFITAMNDCSDYPDTTNDMEGLAYAKRKVEAALNTEAQE